jgi:hypothetical protein
MYGRLLGVDTRPAPEKPFVSPRPEQAVVSEAPATVPTAPEKPFVPDPLIKGDPALLSRMEALRKEINDFQGKLKRKDVKGRELNEKQVAWLQQEIARKTEEVRELAHKNFEVMRQAAVRSDKRPVGRPKKQETSETLGGFYGKMPSTELDKARVKARTDKSRPVEGFLPLSESERISLEESLGRPLRPEDERLYRRTRQIQVPPKVVFTEPVRAAEMPKLELRLEQEVRPETEAVPVTTAEKTTVIAAEHPLYKAVADKLPQVVAPRVAEPELRFREGESVRAKLPSGNVVNVTIDAIDPAKGTAKVSGGGRKWVVPTANLERLGAAPKAEIKVAPVEESKPIPAEPTKPDAKDPMAVVARVIENLEQGKPLTPTTLTKLEAVTGKQLTGVSNAKAAATLRKWVNQQLGVEKARKTRAEKKHVAETVVRPPADDATIARITKAVEVMETRELGPNAIKLLEDITKRELAGKDLATQRHDLKNWLNDHLLRKQLIEMNKAKEARNQAVLNEANTRAPKQPAAAEQFTVEEADVMRRIQNLEQGAYLVDSKRAHGLNVIKQAVEERWASLDRAGRLRIQEKALVEFYKRLKAGDTDALAKAIDVAKRWNERGELGDRKRYTEAEAEAIRQDQERARELRLRNEIMLDINRNVPIRVLDDLDPPEVERVMYQIADLIEESPNAIPRVPEILAQYNIDEVTFARWYREDVKRAARTLASGSWMGRYLREYMKDPDARGVLEEMSQRPPLLSWAGFKERFSRVENLRRAAMTAQLKTAVRNAITQSGNYILKGVEDAVDGVMKVGRGLESSEKAFIQANEDLMAVGRRFKPEYRESLDQLLKSMPKQTAQLLDTPTFDLTYGTKLSRLLSTFNRLQETYFRKLVFDAQIRGELARKGFDVNGMPDTWEVPTKDLVSAAEKAVDESLRITFSQGPQNRLTREILSAYKQFPMLSLIQAFPRFYFGNAMSFLFRYSPAGFLSPKVWKDLAAGNHQRLVSATLGSMWLGLAVVYRMQEAAPGKWHDIRLGKDDRDVDSRIYAPFIAPYLFLGQVIVDTYHKTLGKEARLSQKDYTGAVLGMNRIAGTGLAIVEAMLEERSDLSTLWSKTKYVAGQYVSSFLVPFLQAKDVVAQFSEDERKYRNVAGNEFIGPSLRNVPGLSRLLPEAPAMTRPGAAMSEESDMLAMLEGNVPKGPVLGQLTGLNVRKKSFVEKELERLNIGFAQIAPPGSGQPEIDRRAGFLLGEMMPEVLDEFMQSDVYAELDDAARKTEVLSIIASFRSAAADIALAEHEQRLTDSVERGRGAPRSVPFDRTDFLEMKPPTYVPRKKPTDK